MLTDPKDFSTPTRKLPHSIESEMALLGAIIVNNSAYDRVSGYLRPDHFCLAEHRRIYATCSRLIEAGGLLDDTIVKAIFGDSDELAAAGGRSYLLKIIDAAVTVSNASEYGRLIYDLARRREAIEIAEATVTSAYDTASDRDVGALIDDTRERLSAISAETALDVEDAADAIMEPIPPRQWLLGRVLCREYMTLIAAAGGAGKTTLSIAWALSLATAQPLVGERVYRRSRCLLISLEDGRDELRRRVLAATMHYSLIPDDIRGWLLIRSYADRSGQLLHSDPLTRRAEKTRLSSEIESLIRRQKIDAIVIDPIVKAAAGDENDNRTADLLASLLTGIAIRAGVAVLAVHHIRKGSLTPGDIDAARGAGALKDAARITYTLSPMSSEEAAEHAIPEAERSSYVRLDDGKRNLSTRTANARWYVLNSVRIGNGSSEYPDGDSVQAISRWQPPSVWGDVSVIVANAILDAIDAGTAAGERYTSSTSEDRAAWKVVQDHLPDKSQPQCQTIIVEWVRNGVLRVEKYQSPTQRRQRSGLFVDPLRRPSS